MTSPSLDALTKLHEHFLAQAAEVGQAIAILERARSAPPMPVDIAKVADTVLRQADPSGGSWEPVEIVRSDSEVTVLAHPSVPFDVVLMADEVEGLAAGFTVTTSRRQFRLIGGKIHILVSE